MEHVGDALGSFAVALRKSVEILRFASPYRRIVFLVLLILIVRSECFFFYGLVIRVGLAERLFLLRLLCFLYFVSVCKLALILHLILLVLISVVLTEIVAQFLVSILETDLLEKIVPGRKLGDLLFDGLLADELEHSFLCHLLMVQKYQVISLILIEHEFLSGLGMLEQTILVQTVLIAQKKQAVLGGPVGTPDQTFLELELEKA